jgi:hypothetical protein
MKSRALAAAVALACVVPAAALAHHSFAVYFDPDKEVSITGKVTAFRFTNPHGGPAGQGDGMARGNQRTRRAHAPGLGAG